MKQSRLEFRVLGLCALAISMVISTSGVARAEVGANWMVNGSNISSTLRPIVETSLENKTGSLLTTILGIPVKVLCKEIKLINIQLLKEGAVSSGAAFFYQCATFLEGSALASVPCLPRSGGGVDEIVTHAVGLLVLVGGVGEVLFKSPSEGPLTTIESTAECAVGQKINIQGELIVRDCQVGIKEEFVTHLFEADNVNSTLKASGQKATLDGSVNAGFIDFPEHLGLRWSGLPA